MTQASTQTRLHAWYTQLIKNRPHATDGWCASYQAFTGEVERIRANLKQGARLVDREAYKGTEYGGYEGEREAFQQFTKDLIYEHSNGIAARGLSNVSKDDLAAFVQNSRVVEALEKLIVDPDQETHFLDFGEAWRAMDRGNRPVVINRVLAACTTKVSTTVDEPRFNEVYWWLINEKLIERPPIEASNWRARNLHVMAELQRIFQGADVDEHRLSIFVWELHKSGQVQFTLSKQIVRYGPPGTGKTFVARQQADLLFEIWRAEYGRSGAWQRSGHIETVQFHPSYGYEDFMEGLRPILTDGRSDLRLQNGIFKSLCRRAARWEIDLLNVAPELAARWKELTIQELEPVRSKLDGAVWSHVLERDARERVAEAIPPYFMIIDEMNRAELSRVLGELMYCLEYRGVGGAIRTQYADLNENDTGMVEMEGGFRFFIPHNVYVIGTMNTIDRSVESFDFALRRRFRWQKVRPDYDVLRNELERSSGAAWVELVENLERLNQAIASEPLLGSEHELGQAYLMNLGYPSQLTVSEVRVKVWDERIEALLEEYLRGSGREDLKERFAEAFGITKNS